MGCQGNGTIYDDGIDDNALTWYFIDNGNNAHTWILRSHFSL
jgi:hypothetical protein